jgi:hypothetical protein
LAHVRDPNRDWWKRKASTSFVEGAGSLQFKTDIDCRQN